MNTTRTFDNMITKPFHLLYRVVGRQRPEDRDQPVAYFLGNGGTVGRYWLRQRYSNVYGVEDIAGCHLMQETRNPTKNPTLARRDTPALPLRHATPRHATPRHGEKPVPHSGCSSHFLRNKSKLWNERYRNPWLPHAIFAKDSTKNCGQDHHEFHFRYSHPDRRKLAKRYLELYCSAKREEGNPNRTERIWLDEFCIQPQSQWEAPEEVVKPVRQQELGKLADIFSKADQVAVFCSQMECDHTGIDCSWGQRLFTFAEILHAQHVLRLTIVREEKEFVVRLIHHAAHIFRGAMQTNAALAKRWHLYAVYQHSVNAGAMADGHPCACGRSDSERRDHQISRSRADLASSGWNDLGWLLELNQGFYNAASPAAVCSIPDDRSVSWLGKPIHPALGNERLEPLVTAFPVSGYFTAVWKKKEKTSPVPVPEKPDSKPRVPNPPLTMLAQKTIGLRPTPLKRDKDGLYTNEEMKGLKILAHPNVGIGLYWLTSVLYCILELLVGTMYLERDGWAWLEDADWSANLERSLGKQDSHLRSLVHWGYYILQVESGINNLFPNGSRPQDENRSQQNLWIFGTKSEVIAVARPNAMIPLAVHGSGVTCMLLYRPWDHEDAPSFTGTKVGMCNIPPYALEQTIKTGTVCVTSDAEADLKEVISIQLLSF
ncbi:hypothetical protein C8F04DRAFT_1365292 [Mycena alexandri]|uniref:Heterokaryon incompatibility domain-containing protein n=1 Tax=Mycena alexandri TaxID=1745969 RepID=A0AAD6X0X6_9AGAR|nr:hypothetical protein C8F04DRAFT_1365292 [Mycena alexandri]